MVAGGLLRKDAEVSGELGGGGRGWRMGSLLQPQWHKLVYSAR